MPSRFARDPESSIRQTDPIRFRCVGHHHQAVVLSQARGLLKRQVALPPAAFGESALLRNITEEIADRYLRAEQCRSRAKHAIDPVLKTITIARSYEFTEQLSDFTDLKRRCRAYSA